ncbi:MAG TPA: hypothetical protein PKG81_04700, partial [Candidatus Omnitrophota bacterium]|nr:hypothetical protein [Candidatus Omnitrophota bacterium]
MKKKKAIRFFVPLGERENSASADFCIWRSLRSFYRGSTFAELFHIIWLRRIDCSKCRASSCAFREKPCYFYSPGVRL